MTRGATPLNIARRTKMLTNPRLPPSNRNTLLK
jgi:hypothetical protein